METTTWRRNSPRYGRICQYYLEGRCHFGSRCRNIHQDNRTLNAAANNVIKAQPKLAENNNTETEAGASGFTIIPSMMDLSKFKDKTCGICFDIVVEKTLGERKFGILPNCTHCFCFHCIYKWRQTKEFDREVSYACPECRVASSFVVSSRIWVEAKEEKDKIIEEFKARLSKIDCKFFKKGAGQCRFGNTCMYLHALPSGEKVDVGPPKRWKPRTRNLSPDPLIYRIMLDLDDMEENFFGFDFYDYIEELDLFGDDDDDDSSFGIPSDFENDSDLESTIYII